MITQEDIDAFKEYNQCDNCSHWGSEFCLECLKDETNNTPEDDAGVLQVDITYVNG